MRVTLRIHPLLAALALAWGPHALAQGNATGFEAPRAMVVRPAPGHSLSAPSRQPPARIVADYLRGRGADEATAASLRVVASRPARNSLTHLRLEQQVGGLQVHGAYLKATLNARGELLQLIDGSVRAAGGVAAATVDHRQALRATLARLYPDQAAPGAESGRSGNSVRFAGGNFFDSDPQVTAVAVPRPDGSLAAGYLVETWTRQSNQLHHTLVGGDGRVLAVESRTARDSYNVFTESPAVSPQTVVSGPGAGNAQSPAGWLGSGAQSTIQISGNNVDAYLDAKQNNRPDRGGSTVADGNFLTAVDFAQAPATGGNRAVAVQNLFYLNNVIHDVLYGHGFTEEVGNFQVDNFGKGGKDGDPVQAEAQDGGGTDNANFSTPPDGRKPRMQMFLWTGAGQTHELRVNAPVAVSYNAAGADFGPALTPTGVTGDMLAAVPADGCTAITAPLAGKVALIDRGACDFSSKALNAQQAGAVAVVVANNQGGTAVFTMGAGAGAKRVRIPALMVSQSDGASLKALASPNVTASKLAVQPLQIDGSLDADVVFHEYGHGLTWRMIGGMSGPLAGAVGEGASDVVAMLVNGDDVIAEYSASNPLGIRRNRYAGYPRTYADVTGAEVHNDGEIYAAAMWRAIELFDAAAVPRATLFGYFVDGMNYTPATPSFEQMRDGLLGSIANGSTPSHDCLVWRAFAQFGIGVGALGVVNGSSVTITPSTAVPATCQ